MASSAGAEQVMKPDMLAERADWRAALPDERRGPLQLWFWSIAATTFAVLVVGGITRLTLSGLSIVDWQPIMGVIPPLNEAEWQRTFEIYQQTPDHQWRGAMTLGDFKYIYFWEYLHRLLARTIGLVFLLPFIAFWVRGWLTRPLLKRSLALFGLGALQGVMGWVMVKSGLVDRPSVSHYRLAAHLSLAFLIFGGAVWLARDVARERLTPLFAAERRLLRNALTAVGAVLAVQIIWGAFVAGLRAGNYYPTFPLMGGRLIPPDMLRLEPAIHNFVADPVAVQWTHRVIGTLLALLVIGLFVLVRRHIDDARSRRYGGVLLALIGAQYALGVATVVYLVPVSLGVTHQAVAMIIFGVWLSWLHDVLNSPVRPVAAGG
jgi:heme a synthase